MWDLGWFGGMNSSRLIATGDIVNAYVGLIKEKHRFSNSNTLAKIMVKENKEI